MYSRYAPEDLNDENPNSSNGSVRRVFSGSASIHSNDDLNDSDTAGEWTASAGNTSGIEYVDPYSDGTANIMQPSEDQELVEAAKNVLGADNFRFVVLRIRIPIYESLRRQGG